MRRRCALILSSFVLFACGDDPVEAGADAGADTTVDATPDVASDGGADGSGSDTADVEDGPPDIDLNGVAYDPPACATRAVAGPFEVGVTTIDVGFGPVEVWYPAADGAWRGATRASYDIRTWLPADTSALVPDEAAPLYELYAWRDVDGSQDGPFPLVLFSHGFAGYRMQSATLLTHIASWGYVVVAPEHPERGLSRIVSDLVPAADASPETIRSLLDAFGAGADDGTPFAGMVDMDRVAMTGHSAGGGTTIAVFDDERIDAAIVYAAGSGDLTPTGKPVLFLAGALDGIIPISSVRAGYDASVSPRRLISMARTGHLAFSDLCAVGRDQGGILQIASDYGVPVPSVLLVLGSDGCREGDEPVEVAWPLIHHASVAFLDEALSEAPSTSELDAALETCFGDLVEEQRADVP